MEKELLPLVQAVVEGNDLSAVEAEKAFTILEAEDEQGYFYFALLAALHAKGETSDELLGFCKANERFVPSFNVGVAPDALFDLSGTGGDSIKTPNISTAAAFVTASGGVKVAKQAFSAVTGLTGSADLMQSFGVDPLAISREGKERMKEILARTGMVIYHANSMADPAVRKGYFSFWLKRVPETGLSFRTIYHLAANAYSPIPMKRRVYGVFAERYLKPLAELFQKMGYKKGMVLHGMDGLDEMSNVGPTKVVEFSGAGVKEYTVTPNELGVKTAKIGEIRGSSREGNLADFLKIIYGVEKGPKRDLVLINAAASFYVMNKVANLKDGTQLAMSLVESGKVREKFEEYVKCCGDMRKLESLKKEVAAGS